jgi:hypothetical protein
MDNDNEAVASSESLLPRNNKRQKPRRLPCHRGVTGPPS